MDIDESADQLLNNLQIQISIEHIPFDLIRNNQTVITALQNLVTRAYFDRNYTKRETQDKIDSLIIAVIDVLKTPVVDLTADTEDESASPEQQPDLAAGPSRATEQPAAASEAQDSQEPVQEPPRKRQRAASFSRPSQLFHDDDDSDSSSSDESEIELLKSGPFDTAVENLHLP